MRQSVDGSDFWFTHEDIRQEKTILVSCDQADSVMLRFVPNT